MLPLLDHTPGLDNSARPKTTRVLEMSDEMPLLITEKAAARLIGLSDSTLIAARFRGKPLLPFVRIGRRSIRYRVSDIHEFVNRNDADPSASAASRDHGMARTNRTNRPPL
jgi:predicted DNA-binding transcriptional regulator AlpA